MPCKTENWHALLHEQYFSKHRFLDIYCYEFNGNKVQFLRNGLLGPSFPNILHIASIQKYHLKLTNKNTKQSKTQTYNYPAEVISEICCRRSV